jgi:hypothetical protein
VLVSRMRATRMRETGLTGYYHQDHPGTSALMTAKPWSSRPQSRARCRTRRLAPGVVSLCLIMILGTFFFVLGPGPLQPIAPASASPDCIPCPGGGGLCEPNCGGGGCPEGTVSVSATATGKATEAWINWTTNYGSYNTMSWGNTTSYSYTAVSNQYGGSWNIFLNYLDPNTTYYYHISASKSCYNSGSHSGSFATSADLTDMFSGMIEDVNGTQAPTGMIVQVGCHNPYSGYNYSTQTLVSYNYGAGINYRVSVSLYCQSEGLGYVVFVSNGVLPGTGTWQGRWNETFVVWAPQVVNFGLPTTVDSWIPMTEAFVHNASARAIQENSAYFQSTYTSSSEGESYHSSATWTAYGNFTPPTGQSIIDMGQFYTDGNLVMNAIGNRTPYVAAIQYWGTALRSSDNPTFASDSETLADFNQNTCQYWKQNWPAGTWWDDSVMIAGSAESKVAAGVYLTFGVGVGVGLDFGITGPGVGIGPDLSFIIVTTSSTLIESFHAGWGWQIHYTSPGEFFSVCLDSGGPTGTVIMHIWESSS